MINMFSKIVHFIACKNNEDAVLVAHLFSEEVVSLHVMLKTITSDMDVKFISKFWHHLYDEFSTVS